MRTMKRRTGASNGQQYHLENLKYVQQGKRGMDGRPDGRTHIRTDGRTEITDCQKKKLKPAQETAQNGSKWLWTAPNWKWQRLMMMDSWLAWAEN